MKAFHGSVEADLVLKVGSVVAVLAFVWAVLDWDTYARRVRRTAEALHLRAPAPPRPSGPPVEQIAADLWRIQREIQRAPHDMPAARRRGWVRAYDDVLVDACRALGEEERIYSLPEGPPRDLERERVERVLLRAGFRARSPH